jgi:hypothetical protein
MAATIVWTRRLFITAAVLDFVALLAFLSAYLFSRATIVAWVTTSPAFAGQARHSGIDATVTYATVSVSVVHLVITALFLWLAFALRRRILATVLLVVTTVVDAFVATTPVGGVVQQVVMAVAVLVKIAALVLLWRSPRVA